MTGGRDVTGLRIGGFRVLRELARGGMGVVYEVEREETGGRFALKTLLPSLTQRDPELLARFVREARLAARLDHPHVVRTHAADLEGPTPWLVQDLLPGGSLADLLRMRGGRLPVEEAVALGRKVALGLAHAHERGVLHRDVKPANVLLDEEGEPRLVDFGLARQVDGASRLSVTGQLLGSPAFMAPEQALGDPVDARTDVYGAGALVYTLLAGEPPFRDTGTLGVLEAVISRPPPPLSTRRADVPPEVEAVVLRALAKKPADRFASAAALAEALGGSAAVAPRRAARGAWALAAAASVAVLTGALALAYAAGQRPATRRLPSHVPTSTIRSVPSEASTPVPDWRSTLAGPATYRLTWHDRDDPPGEEQDDAISLTLAQDPPTVEDDVASVTATVCSLVVVLRHGLVHFKYDSDVPAAIALPYATGLEDLFQAVVSARVRFEVDLRTGEVSKVQGMPVAIDAEGAHVLRRRDGQRVRVQDFTINVARDLGHDGALLALLENTLHIFPAQGRATLHARCWAEPTLALVGQRRVRIEREEDGSTLVEGELEGDARAVPGEHYRLVRARTAEEEVVARARVVDGRVVRSELAISFRDLGKVERSRQASTFTFELLDVPPRRE